MMNYKLLSVNTDPSIVNIGDYIQAVAAAQFYPHRDGFIERELLDEYSGDECKMIMNAWYMHNPEHWPPAPNINPFFIAVHINVLAKDKLLAESSVQYLKQHEPIGCRDFNTLHLLQNRNVDSYFSGCLTLTLGYKYYSQQKDDTIYFTEPYYQEEWTFLSLVKNMALFFCHCRMILRISYKFNCYSGNRIKRFMHTIAFYRTYSSIFTDDILANAEYICHQSHLIRKRCHNNPEELFLYAESLVQKYAKAKLVVTSRIHCALPCLGLDTPVIYISNYHQSEADLCRMNGLQDLFNVIIWRNGKLEHTGDLSGKISSSTSIINKNAWRPLADSMIAKCKEWICK